MTPTVLSVILSLASVSLFSVNFIVNKLMLTKLIPHPVSYLVLIMASNLLFLVPAPLFLTLSFSFPGILIATSLGFVFGISFYFQNKLFQIHSADVVSILSRTTPIFTAILSFLFLQERLNQTQYLGVIFLIISGFMVSIIPKNVKKHLSFQTIFYTLTFNLLIAFVTIARKATLYTLDFWSFFYFSQLGSFIVSLFLLSFPSIRKQVIFDMKRFSRLGYVLRLLTFITFIIGTGLYFYALQIGSATIVSSVFAIQPVVVLLYGYLAYKAFTFIQINEINIPLTKKLSPSPPPS